MNKACSRETMEEAAPRQEDVESGNAFEKMKLRSSRRNWGSIARVSLLLLAIAAAVMIPVGLLLTRSDDNVGTSANGGGEQNDSLNNGKDIDNGPIAGEESVNFTAIEGTLGKIARRGSLRCGVKEAPGRAVWSDQINQLEGFSVDLCQAVAAAIFGEENMKIDFVSVQASSRFQALASGDVDLLASWDTFTMERDLFEPTAKTGFTFSVPYLYDGLALGGLHFYEACASSLNTTDCPGLSICVVKGTTYVDILRNLFPDVILVTLDKQEDVYWYFKNGYCKLMSGGQFELTKSVVEDFGYSGEYKVGDRFYSHEPLALVTRDEDPTWSDFVYWIIQGLITAEEQGVEQVFSLASFPRTDLFGEHFEDMFSRSIRTVGNYKEIYDRHLNSIVPRADINRNNKGSSGLLYSMPFGLTETEGPGPISGGKIQQILDRGYLKCGVSTGTIFANVGEDGKISGFDPDFCHALAAALFGDKSKVEFTSLTSKERFIELHEGTVDILSRVTTATFSRDVHEPASGVGFSFAQPNFYDGLTFGGIPPFVECADKLDIASEQCRDLKICTNLGTTFYTILEKLFPDRALFGQISFDKSAEKLNTGECNVVAGGVMDTIFRNVKELGRYEGPYETGKNRHSKDPLALVTNQDDLQWTSFVFWTVSGLIFAEEQGITSENANEMPIVNLFGSRFRNFYRNMIQQVGSYGEIYDRNVQNDIPRGGPSQLNDYPYGPQHFALPGVM